MGELETNSEGLREWFRSVVPDIGTLVVRAYTKEETAGDIREFHEQNGWFRLPLEWLSSNDDITDSLEPLSDGDAHYFDVVSGTWSEDRTVFFESMKEDLSPEKFPNPDFWTADDISNYFKAT